MEFNEPARDASPNRSSVALVARTTRGYPQHPCLGHKIVDGVRGRSSPQAAPHFQPQYFCCLSPAYIRPVALSRRRHVFPEQPSGFWIDKVHPCASRTSDGLVQIGFAISWLTFDPALHVQTGIRATIHKSCSHDPLITQDNSIGL